MTEESTADRRSDGRKGHSLWARSRLFRLGVITGAVLSVLALCTLFLPTYIARWIAADQLDELGVFTEGLKTLGIDLWEGEVWVGPVEFWSSGAERHGQLVEFGVDLSLLNLIERQVLVDRMIVRGLDVEVHRPTEGPITVNGIAITKFLPAQSSGKPLQEGASKPSSQEQDQHQGRIWGAGIDTFELRNSRLLLSDAGGGQLAVEVESMELRGFRTWTPAEPGTFRLSGQANGIDFTLDGKARPFADIITASANLQAGGVRLDRIKRFTEPLLGLKTDEGVLNANLHNEIALHPDGKIQASVDGTIAIRNVHIMKTGVAGVQFAQGNADLDVTYTTEKVGSGQVEGAVKLDLGDASTQLPGGQTAAARSVALKASDLVINVGEPVRTRGAIQLHLGGIRAALPVENAENGSVQRAEFAAETINFLIRDLAAEAEKPDTRVTFSGSLAADTLRASLPAPVAQRSLETSITSLRATLPEVVVTRSPAASAEWYANLSLEVSGASAKTPEGVNFAAQIDKLTLQDGRVSDALDIAIRNLSADSLAVQLTREFLNATGGAGGDQQNPEVAMRSSARVAVQHLALAGPATLQFNDRTVDPALNVTMEMTELDVRNLNTDPREQRTDIDLKAKIGDISTLELAGWAAPFAPEPEFDLAAQIVDLQLAQFSGYAIEQIGRYIERGSLSADVDATADQGQLAATPKLVIRKLEFSSPDASQRQPVASAIGLPIATAVALLENDAGVIELTIPVSGNLDSPEFDFSQAVARAVTGAVREVLQGTLKVLFPPVAIASLLSKDTDDLASLSRPVAFQPGSAELSISGRKIMDRLVSLLESRPKLSVEICGRATAEDLSAYAARQLNRASLGEAQTNGSGEQQGSVFAVAQLSRERMLEDARPKLEQLATERAQEVRRALISRESIKPPRVTECRATFNPNDQGEPRVAVSLQATGI